MKTKLVNLHLIVMIITWLAYTVVMFTVSAAHHADRAVAIANGTYQPMSLAWVTVWIIGAVVILAYGVISNKE